MAMENLCFFTHMVFSVSFIEMIQASSLKIDPQEYMRYAALPLLLPPILILLAVKALATTTTTQLTAHCVRVCVCGSGAVCVCVCGVFLFVMQTHGQPVI